MGVDQERHFGWEVSVGERDGAEAVWLGDLHDEEIMFCSLERIALAETCGAHKLVNGRQNSQLIVAKRRAMGKSQLR